MSSTSSNITQNQASTLFLSFLGAEQGYAILEQTGEEPPQQRGRALKEEEINKLLAAYGLVVNQGAVVAQDGFHVGATTTGLSAVTSYGGPPPLPDVQGTVASANQVASAVNGAADDETMWEGALMWMALSELAHSAMRDMKDAKDVRNIMQTAKRAAKEGEIAATEKNIEAMKDAAWFNFGVSLVAAAASCIVSGFNIGGASSEAFSRALATVLPELGKALNQSSGPQAEANKAQLEMKRKELEAQLFDELIEDSKGNYEEAKELFKLALKVLQEHSERETQAINSALRS
jgi:hypothetical protein